MAITDCLLKKSHLCGKIYFKPRLFAAEAVYRVMNTAQLDYEDDSADVLLF